MLKLLCGAIKAHLYLLKGRVTARRSAEMQPGAEISLRETIELIDKTVHRAQRYLARKDGKQKAYYKTRKRYHREYGRQPHLSRRHVDCAEAGKTVYEHYREQQRNGIDYEIVNRERECKRKSALARGLFLLHTCFTAL